MLLVVGIYSRVSIHVALWYRSLNREPVAIKKHDKQEKSSKVKPSAAAANAAPAASVAPATPTTAKPATKQEQPSQATNQPKAAVATASKEEEVDLNASQGDDPLDFGDINHNVSEEPVT